MADGKGPKGVVNSSFEIFNVPSRGRGIKTKVPLNQGNCVLSSEAYAFVSRSEFLGKTCDSCLSASDKLKRCSGCKMVYYCSQACQKNAWGTHKLECKHLKKMSPIMPSDTVRLLALIILKNDRAKWLDDLVGHPDKIRQEKSEVFAYMFEMLNKYLDGSIQWGSERVFELFCKVNCNAFTICDGELRPIGLGLYQTLAFLNHSCEPNCIAVFNGPRCEIRSIKKVEQEGELCIAYTELLRPQSIRHKELKEQYYFDCTCRQCAHEIKHGSEMNALKCVKKDCSKTVGFYSGTTQDETCSECGSNLQQTYTSPRINKLYEKIETSLSTVSEMTSQSESSTTHQSESSTEALRVCEDLLTDVGNVLHDYNYQVIKIVDKISDLCIEMGLWNKATHYCTRSLDGYLKYYPKYHPSTAIQLYRIGKMEIYLEKLDAGISLLCQARSLLEVCYGKEHSLTRQLNQLISQTTQDMFGQQNFSMLEH